MNGINDIYTKRAKMTSSNPL